MYPLIHHCFFKHQSHVACHHPQGHSPGRPTPGSPNAKSQAVRPCIFCSRGSAPGNPPVVGAKSWMNSHEVNSGWCSTTPQLIADFCSLFCRENGSSISQLLYYWMSVVIWVQLPAIFQSPFLVTSRDCTQNSPQILRDSQISTLNNMRRISLTEVLGDQEIYAMIGIYQFAAVQNSSQS